MSRSSSDARMKLNDSSNESATTFLVLSVETLMDETKKLLPKKENLNIRRNEISAFLELSDHHGRNERTKKLAVLNKSSSTSLPFSIDASMEVFGLLFTMKDEFLSRDGAI